MVGWLAVFFKLGINFKRKHGPLRVRTWIRNHNIKSSLHAMNHFLYLLLLFGWKAPSPGGQLRATLLTSDRGRYPGARKDSTRNTAKINQFMKEVEVTPHLPPGKALLCFPKSSLRVTVVKSAYLKANLLSMLLK